MKNHIVKSVICNLIVSAALQAGPITYQPQDEPHSKNVIVNGEPKILLPDGRIIPTGQYTICDGGMCNLKDEIGITTLNTPNWKWLLVPAGGTAIILLLTRMARDSSVSLTPAPVVPPTFLTPGLPLSPPINVPEPATLTLLGLGLCLIVSRLRKPKNAK